MTNKDKKIIQKIVLAGVIIEDGKVLILQRSQNENVYPGMWELPSGKREPPEPSEDSLVREIKEETGLNVKPVMPFSVFDYQVEKPEEIRDSTQINFLVTTTNNNNVILSQEHQAFAWITMEDIEKYDITDATNNVIKKALETDALIN